MKVSLLVNQVTRRLRCYAAKGQARGKGSTRRLQYGGPGVVVCQELRRGATPNGSV